MPPPATTKLALRLAATKAQGGRLIPNVAPATESSYFPDRFDSRGLVVGRANGSSVDTRIVAPQGPFDQQMTLLAGFVPEGDVATKKNKQLQATQLERAADLPVNSGAAANLPTIVPPLPIFNEKPSLLAWSANLILSGSAHEGQVLNILHYWGWQKIVAAMKIQANSGGKKLDTYRGTKLIESVADTFLSESGIDIRKLPLTLSVDGILFWAAELKSVGGDATKLSPKLRRRMEHFGLTLEIVCAAVGEYQSKNRSGDRSAQRNC